MEKPKSENRRFKPQPKNREIVPIQTPPPQPLRPAVRPPPPNQAELAAIAVDLNVRLRSAEMPGAMQERAFRCARAALDANLDKRVNPTHIAMRIKKEFDSVYGPAWHCIVGKSFGSFVTHSSGGFVYFSADKFSFLLFKTEVRPVKRGVMIVDHIYLLRRESVFDDMSTVIRLDFLIAQNLL